MEIGAVLIGAALALAAGFYLAKPVIEMDQVSTTRGDRELSSLLATRDHILDIIHELDMDHSLGKIPTEDYQAERYSLVKQGAFILREIDSLTAGGAGEEPA